MIDITATMPMEEYEKLKTDAVKYKEKYDAARTIIAQFLNDVSRHKTVREDFILKGQASVKLDSIDPFRIIVEYAKSLEQATS